MFELWKGLWISCLEAFTNIKNSSVSSAKKIVQLYLPGSTTDLGRLNSWTPNEQLLRGQTADIIQNLALIDIWAWSTTGSLCWMSQIWRALERVVILNPLLTRFTGAHLSSVRYVPKWPNLSETKCIHLAVKLVVGKQTKFICSQARENGQVRSS